MNKNKTIAFFILLCITLNTSTFYAQKKLKGNKIVVSEDRGISEFNAIEIKDKIDVILVQGNDQSVIVETDENLQSAIFTEVRGNTLVVKISKKISKKKVLAVYITVNDSLEKITIKDKATIKTDGSFNFEDISINAEGNSKIMMDLKAEKVILNNNESASVNLTINTNNITINASNRGKSKINLSSKTAEFFLQGNSTTELEGDCEDVFVTAENKSNVKASKLECNNVFVTASDASDVYINSRELLTISATNTAEVYIFGVPKITIEKFTDKAILRKK